MCTHSVTLAQTQITCNIVFYAQKRYKWYSLVRYHVLYLLLFQKHNVICHNGHVTVKKNCQNFVRCLGHPLEQQYRLWGHLETFEILPNIEGLPLLVQNVKGYFHYVSHYQSWFYQSHIVILIQFYIYTFSCEQENHCSRIPLIFWLFQIRRPRDSTNTTEIFSFPPTIPCSRANCGGW